MWLTEYTVDKAERLWTAWLQRKGNVHDIALTNGRGPRLHHVGVWAGDGQNIIRAADILAGAMEGDRICYMILYNEELRSGGLANRAVLLRS